MKNYCDLLFVEVFTDVYIIFLKKYVEIMIKNIYSLSNDKYTCISNVYNRSFLVHVYI